MFQWVDVFLFYFLNGKQHNASFEKRKLENKIHYCINAVEFNHMNLTFNTFAWIWLKQMG